MHVTRSVDLVEHLDAWMDCLERQATMLQAFREPLFSKLEKLDWVKALTVWDKYSCQGVRTVTVARNRYPSRSPPPPSSGSGKKPGGDSGGSTSKKRKRDGDGDGDDDGDDDGDGGDDGEEEEGGGSAGVGSDDEIDGAVGGYGFTTPLSSESLARSGRRRRSPLKYPGYEAVCAAVGRIVSVDEPVTLVGEKGVLEQV